MRRRPYLFPAATLKTVGIGNENFIVCPGSPRSCKTAPRLTPAAGGHRSPFGKEAANLSLDFLVGFTVFIVAFIYVTTLIPGLLLDLQNKNIDYDAVAYRTGVILTEDTGSPSLWESPAVYSDYYIQTNNIRLGLALSKDTPDVLSVQKINRFYCSTLFSYPFDYRSRAVFGDYPYTFNISLRLTDKNTTQTIGDIRPAGYGYIRRVVKIKNYSNVTIGQPVIQALNMSSDQNVTKHLFTVLFNSTDLIDNPSNPACKNPLYRIDPWGDQLMVNITDLEGTRMNATTTSNLTSLVILKAQQSQPFPNPSLAVEATFDSSHPITGIPPIYLYVDGNATPVTTLPAPVFDNVSLVLSPGYFYNMGGSTVDHPDTRTQLYVQYTFTLNQNDHYLNNTYFPNKTAEPPFSYTYNSVTPSSLGDGVMEISVW